MSRQSGREEDVVNRIGVLEEMIQEMIQSQGNQLKKLYDLVNKMKDNFDKLLGIPESGTSQFRAVYGISERKPNPWALETSRLLTDSMQLVDNEHMSKRIGRLFETYRPTIEALESAPKGLTADEVKAKTGRSRNTESTYLWRLYLAGYLTRKKKRRKVFYKLKDTSGLKQVFGER